MKKADTAKQRCQLFLYCSVQTKLQFIQPAAVLHHVSRGLKPIAFIEPPCACVGAQDPQCGAIRALPDGKGEQPRSVSFVLFAGQHIQIFDQAAAHRDNAHRLFLRQQIQARSLCDLGFQIALLAFGRMDGEEFGGTDFLVGIDPAFGMDSGGLRQLLFCDRLNHGCVPQRSSIFMRSSSCWLASFSCRLRDSRVK